MVPVSTRLPPFGAVDAISPTATSQLMVFEIVPTTRPTDWDGGGGLVDGVADDVGHPDVSPDNYAVSAPRPGR